MLTKALSSVLLLLARSLPACGGRITPETLPSTPVPILSIEQVAGRWAGLLKTQDETHQDWLDVVIAKNGEFEFSSYRTIGGFLERGVFTLSDGKLTTESPKGGRRLLSMKMMGNSC